MWFMKMRLWMLTMAVLFAVGCVGGTVSGGELSGSEVTIQAQFEKRLLGATGFGGTETRPLRYGFVEIRKDSDDSVVASGFLDESGRGYANVPNNLQVYLVAYAQVGVPSSGTDYVMQGSVKNTKMLSRYTDITAFNNLRNVYVTSNTLTARSGATLSLLVPTTRSEAGAFNISDQMVTFAKGLAAMDSTLRLPNLHAFWSSDYAFTSYPEVAVDAQNYVLRQSSTGRSVFQFPVRRSLSNGADAGADEFNDGVLLESMAHLLFASYSFPADGTKATSILRRDNDNVYVSRYYQSEAAMAFIDGYCDFLAGAWRNNRLMVDVDSSGKTYPFFLDDHTQFSVVQGQGEFYRGSVAISLWGIWKQALNGSSSGLAQMWQAARSSRESYAYNNAPLGCYGTYLVGLRNLIGPNAWSSALNELAKESIGDITAPAYFNGNALWSTQFLPFQVQDGVRTYAQDIYYDRDQSKAYRITQNTTGSRQFTLTNTGGQDLFLEVIGPNGLVGASWDPPVSSTRSLSVNLTPGEYLIRVRAGYTTANNPNATFRLTGQ